MNNKLLTTLTIATLLLTACGSDSKSSSESVESQIKKKDFIIVGNNKNDCDRILDKQKLANTIENTLAIPKKINIDSFLLVSKEGIQFCQNYNRTADEIDCASITFNEATQKSCIIGFDFEK